MRATPSVLRPYLAALAAANLALIVLAVTPFLGEHAPSAASRLAAHDEEVPSLKPLPPPAAYAATIERPLFSPSRRPPAQTAQSTMAGHLRLEGVIIDGTARRALVADLAAGRRFTVGEGARIDGWTVRRIGRNAIVLASPAGAATLALQPAVSGAKP